MCKKIALESPELVAESSISLAVVQALPRQALHSPGSVTKEL